MLAPPAAGQAAQQDHQQYKLQWQLPQASGRQVPLQLQQVQLATAQHVLWRRQLASCLRAFLA
jgi:hypothetical protein